MWIPVSVGELFDKITILEIKSERITDAEKLHNVNKQLDALCKVASNLPRAVGDENEGRGEGLRSELRDINATLWELEDQVRHYDEDGPEALIPIARAIFHANDRRAAVKRQIDIEYGSAIIEEKQYAGG